jgi:non-heme chloroperoxidase
MSTLRVTRSSVTLVFLFILVSVGAAAALAGNPGARSTKGGFVTTPDGVRIHYLEAGRGPALLFVPGWTMPAEIWEPQIAHFSKKYRVVAIDPRSQGQSSQTTEGHHPAARAADIKAVVNQLRLAPVVLVGWSMGVLEAVSYVDQFGTDTLRALVLVDGMPGWDFHPEYTPQMFRWMASFQKDRRKAAEAFVRDMYRTPQSEDYLRRVIEATLRTPTNTAISLFVGAFTNDQRPALAKIDKPTLITVARSPYLPLYEELKQRLPAARFEIFDNAGHALFVDQAERFNALLDEFLAKLPER